jgi:hypothetical protein
MAAGAPLLSRQELTQDKEILAAAGNLGMLPASFRCRQIIAIQARLFTLEET